MSLHLDGESHQTMLVGQAAIGRYGSSSGEWTTDMFIEAVYADLAGR